MDSHKVIIYAEMNHGKDITKQELDAVLKLLEMKGFEVSYARHNIGWLDRLLGGLLHGQ